MQINKYALWAILAIIAFFVLKSCVFNAEAATAPGAPTGVTMSVSATVVASPALGKKTFDADCIDCHEASDYAGATVAEIQKSLTIAKMKDIKLSLKQMQDLEAYFKTL